MKSTGVPATDPNHYVYSVDSVRVQILDQMLAIIGATPDGLVL